MSLPQLRRLDLQKVKLTAHELAELMDAFGTLHEGEQSSQVEQAPHPVLRLKGCWLDGVKMPDFCVDLSQKALSGGWIDGEDEIP